MAKAAMNAAIVLILVSFLTCCIIPMLRRQCLQAMDKRADVMMGLQGPRMENVLANGQMTHMRPVVQGLLGDVDLLPIPDHLDNADNPEDKLGQEEDEF